VAGAVAPGDEPSAAPACAVHTEAPVASNVTPSAAATNVLFQPRLLLRRAMSVPFTQCFTGPDHLAITDQDETHGPTDASVTDHGQAREGSRTTAAARQ
jgi:hypothetical protein